MMQEELQHVKPDKLQVVGKFEIDRLMNLDEDEIKNAMQRVSEMDIQ